MSSTGSTKSQVVTTVMYPSIKNEIETARNNLTDP